MAVHEKVAYKNGSNSDPNSAGGNWGQLPQYCKASQHVTSSAAKFISAQTKLSDGERHHPLQISIVRD